MGPVPSTTVSYTRPCAGSVMSRFVLWRIACCNSEDAIGRGINRKQVVEKESIVHILYNWATGEGRDKNTFTMTLYNKEWTARHDVFLFTRRIVRH